MEIRSLAILTDSQLIVNQIKGLFKARQPTIKQNLQKVKEILKGFNTYTIENIRRNQNKKADALSKLASMTFEHLTKEVLVEVLVKRLIDNKEVSKVEADKGENWITPIYEYLLSGLLSKDLKEARKVRIRASPYKLIKGSLYKKSLLTPWLRCISPTHADNIVKEIHEGSCGFNTKPRSVVVKVMKQGYYWPLIYKDAAKIIQDRTQCQEQSMEKKVSRKYAITVGNIWPLGSQHPRPPTNGSWKLKVPRHSRGALY
ncbi:reverse transcriptase domain-containing protein [Tanacetum coccineum]